MEIILDTNFIITCIKQKIPFIEEIMNLIPDAEIVVPEQVIMELEKAEKNKELKIIDRNAANLGLQLTKNLRKIKLNKKYVDKGILEYVKDNPDAYVATLDKELKNQIRNTISIRGKRKLAIS